jgi:hypothetical protein
MNKILYLGALLPVLAMIAPHAFASSDQQHFQTGWYDGQTAAINDWNSNVKWQSADTNCGDHHTQHYCSGYWSGYNDEWNRSVNLNTNVVQSQGADVNIKGNNNHVDINQGQASSNGGSDNGGSSSGHGANPRCVIACIS